MINSIYEPYIAQGYTKNTLGDFVKYDESDLRHQVFIKPSRAGSHLAILKNAVKMYSVGMNFRSKKIEESKCYTHKDGITELIYIPLSELELHECVESVNKISEKLWEVTFTSGNTETFNVGYEPLEFDTAFGWHRR